MPERTLAVIDIGSSTGRVSVFRMNGGGHCEAVAESRDVLLIQRGLSASGRAEAADKRQPDWRSSRPLLSNGDDLHLEKTGLRLALADELNRRLPPDSGVPVAFHDVQRARSGVDLPAPHGGRLATPAERISQAFGWELRFEGGG